MSIFGSILSKIFPSSHPAVTTAQAGTPASGAAAPAQGGAPAAAQAASPAAKAMPAVDVERILTEKAQQRGEKLNWRTSIVDLMKLLDLDSSMAARKALAAELHYSGDTNDSAAMNMWLQKQVMKKLADNGGQVPADLKD